MLQIETVQQLRTSLSSLVVYLHQTALIDLCGYYSFSQFPHLFGHLTSKSNPCPWREKREMNLVSFTCTKIRFSIKEFLIFSFFFAAAKDLQFAPITSKFRLSILLHRFNIIIIKFEVIIVLNIF